MLLALALATTVSATPRVLVVGTRFDDVDDATRARIMAAVEEAFIAARTTVRISNCRDDKCAASEAAMWRPGATITVSAARLGADVSVAIRAVTSSGKNLAKSDTLVDLKKLDKVNNEIDKFAAKLRSQIPITAAPDAPVAPMPEPEALKPAPAPAAEPAPAPAPEAVVSQPEPQPAKKSSAAGLVMLIGAAALVVASVAVFSFALVDDGRLASSRMVGNDGVGRWSLTRAQADGLRSTTRLELGLGGALAGVGVALGVVAIAVW